MRCPCIQQSIVLVTNYADHMTTGLSQKPEDQWSCKRSPDIWTSYKYKNKFRQILHCLKMGQSQLRVIIYINFVKLEYIMLHAKFHDHRISSSVEEDF